MSATVWSNQSINSSNWTKETKVSTSWTPGTVNDTAYSQEKPYVSDGSDILLLETGDYLLYEDSNIIYLN
jgi:hypothetical protein